MILVEHVRRQMSNAAALAIIAAQAAGCGVTAPRIEEHWEAQDVSARMAFYIKKNIFCDLVRSIKEVNKEVTINDGPSIPEDYGVQMQIGLTVEENSSINPALTINKPLPLMQSFNIGLGGTLSATATRVDTTYSYYNVGKIAGKGKNDSYCDESKSFIDRRGSSLLLQTDLGIKDFLLKTVQPVAALSSSKPGSKKIDKLDVYSYEIKFAVVTNGGANPVWKLVDLTVGGGPPLLTAGRNRTHDLILTFGPDGSNGYEPSQVSLQQHFTSQLINAVNRRLPYIP